MVSRWTERELYILEEYYPKGGYFLCKSNGLDRPRDATLKKAQTLGVRVIKNGFKSGKNIDRWADWELAILSEEYPKKGKKGVANILTHRTESAIYVKAISKGLSCPTELRVDSWTPEELALLEIYYRDYGTVRCQEEGLNRSKSSIVKKANSMGLKMDKDKRAILLCNVIKDKRSSYLLWSDEELNILDTYYKDYGCKVCQSKGIDRVLTSIYRKAKSRGLTKRGI